MNQTKIQLRFIILVGMILLAALSRLLPHPPNFTPVGAIALFGAAYFSRKSMSIVVPLVALWLSDLLLNNVLYAQYYEGFVWLTGGFYWIMGSFILIALLGMVTLKKITVGRLIGTSLGASALFFLITNFGVWASSMMYPKTIGGLVACYTAGLPFFFNTLAGDVFFVVVLFGTFEWVQKRYPQLAVIH